MRRRRFIITTVTTITPPVMIVMMVTVAPYCCGRREAVWLPGVMIKVEDISPFPVTSTIDGHRHNHHHCHTGSLLVMVVTITRIVLVAGREVCPGERGPSWR